MTGPSLRILVFRIGALGDTLVSVPALYAVRQHFGSSAHISLLRNSDSPTLVTPDDVLSPHSCIDDFIEYPSKGNAMSRFVAMAKLAITLRRMNFDVVVYLVPAQRSAFSVLRDRIFFQLSGIMHHAGFHAFSRQELFPRTADGKTRGVRAEACFLLDRLRTDGIEAPSDINQAERGIELTEAENDIALKWLRNRGWDGKKTLVAIAPGSKHLINCWPLKNFAEVGNRLSRSLPCQIVVVGGKKEHQLGEELLRIWGHGINAAGSFAPRGTAALLEYCRLLIGLDTGTTHLAAAVGTRCVGLYSAKDNPGRWHPLGNGHEVLRKDVEVLCAGCMLQKCKYPICRCMDLITVDEVVKVAIKVISSRYPGADASVVSGSRRKGNSQCASL